MSLVDDSWHCWLLEANAEPDFKQTGDRLKPMLQYMMEDAFQLIIDPLHPFNPVQASSHQPNTVYILSVSDAVGHAKPSDWQSVDVCLRKHTRLASRDAIDRFCVLCTSGIDPDTATEFSDVVRSRA